MTCVALKLKDRLPEAVTEFRKAIALDPEQPDAHYTLGVTLWQQGELPAAEAELRAAIRVKPDYAEAHYTLGTVLKQEGKLPEAAGALREAIRLQPDFSGAHTTLAAVLRQLGDKDAAAVEAKAGAEIARAKNNLQSAVFATNSGKRLMNAGDLDGAISQFRSAISAKPDYAAAHYELGLVLRRKGDAGGAAKELQEATRLDPRLVAPTP